VDQEIKHYSTHYRLPCLPDIGTKTGIKSQESIVGSIDGIDLTRQTVKNDVTAPQKLVSGTTDTRIRKGIRDETTMIVADTDVMESETVIGEIARAIILKMGIIGMGTTRKGSGPRELRLMMTI
jgi:hypothetical protein